MNKSQLKKKVSTLNEKKGRNLAYIPKSDASKQGCVTNTVFLAKVKKYERAFRIYIPKIAARNAELKHGDMITVSISKEATK